MTKILWITTVLQKTVAETLGFTPKPGNSNPGQIMLEIPLF